MPSLSFDQCLDLVASTLDKFEKRKWVDISQERQDLVFFNKLFKGRSNKTKYITGGEGIGWRIQHSHSSTARHVGPWDPDVSAVTDKLTTARMPWCRTTNNYMLNTTIEALNRGTGEQIVDLLEVEKNSCTQDTGNLIEATGWGTPTNSDDVLTPAGIRYYLVDGTTEGFTGTVPAGHTTVATVSTTTHTGWKNYYAPFTAYTMADFIDKLCRAMRKTKFKPTYDHAKPGGEDSYGFYANETVISNIQQLIIASNQNFGKDLTGWMNAGVIANQPPTWVPYLDEVSGNRLFGINWGQLDIAVQSGWDLAETKPARHPENHVVMVIFQDLIWQLVAYNRREAGFVMKSS